jgi:hypothetical protein
MARRQKAKAKAKARKKKPGVREVRAQKKAAAKKKAPSKKKVVPKKKPIPKQKDQEVTTQVSKKRPASKKKIGAKKKPKKKNALAKATKQTNQLFDKASKIGEKHGFFEPSETVSTQVTQPVQNVIDESHERYESSKEYSPEVAEAITMLQGGLGGLTAQENNAIRDNAAASMNAAFSTSMRDIMGRNARFGIRGGVAANPMATLGRDYMGQRRAFENQMLVDNINVQDNRRNAYTNFLNTANAQRLANNQNAFNTYSNLVGNADAAMREAERFNIGQQEQDLQKRISGISGIAGVIGANRAGIQNNKLIRQQMNAQNSGGGGGGAPEPNPFSQQYLDGLQRITTDFNNAIGGGVEGGI